MKKQTKVLVTLSAAALLAVGASAVSFAEGWDNSTGVWQYLDKDGNAVTSEWKSSNGQYFWLDEDGNMATDSVIEDATESKPKYYYVDANGARVTNTWKAVAKDDDDDSDAEYYWMYFGSDGKAYTTAESDEKLSKSKIKTINGLKYAFDAEGHMLYGWISETDRTQHDSDEKFWSQEDVKYYGNGWNDGHLQTGWKQITVVNDDDEEKEYWFYFGSDGVMVKNKVGKNINGVKYNFAEDGHMLDDWAAGTTTDLSSGVTAGQVSYFNGNGAMRKNKWIYAVPAENYIKENDVDGTGDIDNGDYEDDENRWFYVNSSGKLVAGTIKRLNGKKYAFDIFGRMKKNFVIADGNDYNGNVKNDKVTRDSFLKAAVGEPSKVTLYGKEKLYYFSNDDKNDGSLKKGFQTIELDDDTYQFYFSTSDGAAQNGYNSTAKKFVANGLVIKPADNDPNYIAVKAEYKDTTNVKGDIVKDIFASDATSDNLIATGHDAENGYVLINKSGAVMKSKTKQKDENDHYYVTNKYGFVLKYFDNEDAYKEFFKNTKITVGSKTRTLAASDLTKSEYATWNAFADNNTLS
jgi:glucan-binding YG repeat protein